MKAKLFEVRDRATFIAVLAVKMEPTCEADRYLLARSGYGLVAEQQATYVCLSRIEGEHHQATCDPYAWEGRTMPAAHRYIVANWDQLNSGDVVDARVALGEAAEPVASDRLSEPSWR